MKTTLRLFLATAVCTLSLMTVAAQTQSIPAALTPNPRADDWWQKRHAEKCEIMKAGDIDLLMIGDSITHGWENQKQVWEKFYGGKKILNLGFSGDQTQHVLWRLQNSPLDAVKPKAAVIMIGTNNIGNDAQDPKDVALGIRAIVHLLQEKYPDIKIFVLYVFPRDNQPDGKLRVKTVKINSYLPGFLGDVKNVTLIDINNKFLDVNGVLEPYIMPDFLHPNTYGYVLWGKAVEPFLKPILETPTPAAE
ncbi:MAG: GDSL-type esterase/lipase family protein [Planctomycetaceae bacterium]|jgi:beta-glucosidase|nr:GDSL-type esterase/lipase family protein [Planctomycetaceae bacterium]